MRPRLTAPRLRRKLTFPAFLRFASQSLSGPRCGGNGRTNTRAVVGRGCRIQSRCGLSFSRKAVRRVCKNSSMRPRPRTARRRNDHAGTQFQERLNHRSDSLFRGLGSPTRCLAQVGLLCSRRRGWMFRNAAGLSSRWIFAMDRKVAETLAKANVEVWVPHIEVVSTRPPQRTKAGKGNAVRTCDARVCFC